MNTENFFAYLLIFFCCLALITVLSIIGLVLLVSYQRLRSVLLTIGFIREVYFLLKEIYLNFFGKNSKGKSAASKTQTDFIDAEFREKN